MSFSHASEEDYLQHARHNEGFLNHLLDVILKSNSRYSDWGFVVVFYAALHYTHAAILRDHNKNSTNHSDIDRGHFLERGHNSLVREHLPSIKREYLDMYGRAREARYGSFHNLKSAVGEVERQRRALHKIKRACLYD